MPRPARLRSSRRKALDRSPASADRAPGDRRVPSPSSHQAKRLGRVRGSPLAVVQKLSSILPPSAPFQAPRPSGSKSPISQEPPPGAVFFVTHCEYARAQDFLRCVDIRPSPRRALSRLDFARRSRRGTPEPRLGSTRAAPPPRFSSPQTPAPPRRKVLQTRRSHRLLVASRAGCLGSDPFHARPSSASALRRDHRGSPISCGTPRR